jgi:DNA polymerase delta subunit 1
VGKEVDKYVFVVGGCDDIRGRNALLQNRRSYEKVSSTAFEIDPDIVTGYNIMGFDFMYIYKRATDINDQHAGDGKDRTERDERNQVYVDVPQLFRARRQRSEVHPHAGRILIDLMKVVQRDHKLTATRSTPYLNTSSVIRKMILLQDIFRLQEGTTLTVRQSPAMCARLRSVQLSVRKTLDGRR